jgi:lipoprotein-anchoring transpeptidase ErfK/SrfK
MEPTDMYVRRGDSGQGGPRRLWTILLILALAGAAVSWGLWALRNRAAPTPEGDPPPEAAPSAGPPVSLSPSPIPPSPPSAPDPGPAPSVPVLPPPAPVPAPTPAPGPVSVPTPVPAAADASAAHAPALALWAETETLMKQGEWGPAREKALAALQGSPNPALRRTIEDALGDIHIRLVFSRAPMEEKVEYVIQSGDSLDAIARRQGTTVELLLKGNQLSGPTIRPGDRLRILTGTFRAVVDLSDREMTLWLNDRFFKRYAVGTGKHETTPTGDFKITDRIAQPTWWRPDGRSIPYGDPDNELGTHWLALDVRGYGLHGTWKPETIGHAESAGCVRFHNEDIEELFTLLPRGVAVTIQP